MNKYYVLSKLNINGPEYITYWWISDTPGKTNGSKQPRTKGWLGTTSNVSYEAHGEFDTKEEALDFIKEHKEKWDVIEDEDEDDNEYNYYY